MKANLYWRPAGSHHKINGSDDSFEKCYTLMNILKLEGKRDKKLDESVFLSSLPILF